MDPLGLGAPIEYVDCVYVSNVTTLTTSSACGTWTQKLVGTACVHSFRPSFDLYARGGRAYILKVVQS